MDIKTHRARWQLKTDETFRVRFKTLEPEEGRVTLSLQESPDQREHWVEFKMWDYAKSVELRKQATKHHPETRTFYVDHDLLNELKVRQLMKAWSFGEEDPHLRLQHVNGYMTDESWEAFRALYPAVSQVILDKMNEVLEGFA